MKNALVTMLVVSSLVACSSAPEPAALPEPPSEAVSEVAGLNLPRAVQWQRNSAEVDAIYHQTFRLAEWVLEAQVAELKVGTWAVAIDADETIIDNSLYARELVEAAETMTWESWGEWVERREATPLPGVMGFLTRVRELGGRIAVVTNRREEHCEATRDVFSRHRIPFDVVLCQGDERRKDGRWEMVQTGAAPGLPPLKIVMWLGDNIHDFPGLDQAARLGDESAFAEFGTRFFIFPNPAYGSWEDNPEE